MDLLKKLYGLSIQPTDKITKEDQKFIDTLKKRYFKVTDQLLNCKKLFLEQEKLNSEAEELWEADRDGDYVHQAYSDDEKVWGARYYYTFKYPLKHVKGLIWSAYVSAEHDMIKYFSESYNLRMDYDDYREICKKIPEIFDFDHCLEWILSQTGGLSLTDTGIKLLKEDFAGEVNDRKNSPKLNKNTITFPDYMYYRNGDSLDWGENRKYYRLLKAILHFETGVAAIDMPSDAPKVCGSLPNEKHGDKDKFTFTYAYETILSKVIAIRFYKNGKVDVKFASPELAMEFANYYSIVLAA